VVQSLDTCPNFGVHYKVLSSVFEQYDAILTAVTPGPAPVGLQDTGSPIFCGLWTLYGGPTLNMPLGKTAQELPLGCQWVGAPHGEQRLLHIANLCWALLREMFGDIEMPASK
jgi:Asp-tRNA(Asn)/Glu-tRNA(Gln) amidotransferase A subunit family amidase